jgi:hypothetical protein
MSDVLPRLTPAFSDKYRIECELGPGGMATVFRAHDLNWFPGPRVKLAK